VNEYVYAMNLPFGETTGKNGPLKLGTIGLVRKAVVMGLFRRFPRRLSRYRLIPLCATIRPRSSCDGFERPSSS